jgi:adenosylcobinamide kinase/adenosylcobinamide-phosphate guanylyltransferase
MTPGSALVVGGVRSGKSRFAEELAAAAAARLGVGVTYLATAEPLDAEMADRIRRHQSRRPPDWATVEEPRRVAERLGDLRHTVVLIECLTLLLTNWMMEGMEDEGQFVNRRDRLAASIGTAPLPVIVVSNEVGWGVVPANAMARQFADWLGLLNQAVAEQVESVYLTVAGLPLALRRPPAP